MSDNDPIIQCEECGAKLKLKAATLKVVRQLRCGKCKVQLEIPAVLRENESFPDEPVLAKRLNPEDGAAHRTDPAGAVKPVAPLLPKTVVTSSSAETASSAPVPLKMPDPSPVSPVVPKTSIPSAGDSGSAAEQPLPSAVSTPGGVSSPDVPCAPSAAVKPLQKHEGVTPSKPPAAETETAPTVPLSNSGPNETNVSVKWVELERRLQDQQDTIDRMTKQWEAFSGLLKKAAEGLLTGTSKN